MIFILENLISSERFLTDKMKSKYLSILVVLLLETYLVDSDGVQITSTKPRILFSQQGKLISQVSFATIRTQLDLTPIKIEVDTLCSTAAALHTSLQHKLKDCDENCNTTNTVDKYQAIHMRNRGQYLKTPWTNHIKKRLISALIIELENLCTSNKRILKELIETFQLNLPRNTRDIEHHEEKLDVKDRHQSLAQRHDNLMELFLYSAKPLNPINREKRQILVGMAVGIVSSLISSFTSSQLFSMSSSKENELIDGQNHMILALQEHESRLSRNEDDVHKLKHRLGKIDAELAKMIAQNTILAEC